MPIDPSNKNHIDSLITPAPDQWNTAADTPLALTSSFDPSDLNRKDIPQRVLPVIKVTDVNEKARFIEALERWEHVAEITHEPGQEGSKSAKIVMAEGDYVEPEGAKVQAGGVQLSVPGANGLKAQAGVYVDPRYQVIPGNYGYASAVHEFGHAIGLKHPGNFSAGDSDPSVPLPYLPPEQQNRDYSAMAYDPGAQAIGGNDPVTPMPYDIAAAQYLYGANLKYHAGNTTYTLEPGKKMTVNGTKPDGGAEATEVIEGGAMTIWDAGARTKDVDTLQVPLSYTGEVQLDLRPSSVPKNSVALGDDGLHYSAIGGTRVFNAIVHDDAAKVIYGELENATGGAGNDRLIGNAVSNTLIGNEGNDILIDGAGNDRMEGGPGKDYYAWDADTIDKDTIVDTDNLGVVATKNQAHYLLPIPNLPAYSMEADYNLLVDGALLATNPTGPSSTPIGYLKGSQLDIQRGQAHLIVENMPANGALGINILPANCQVSVGDTPTCGADGIERLVATTLDMGSGNDYFRSLAPGDAVDNIQLGSGADRARTEKGSDEIHGGPGSDEITPGLGSDKAFGDEGNDIISGVNDPNDPGSTDEFHGGPGNDLLLGGTGVAVRLDGEEGDDVLYAKGTGNPKDTELNGGIGNDTFVLDGSGTINDGVGNNLFIINIDALRVTGGSAIINTSAPTDKQRNTYDTEKALIATRLSITPMTVKAAEEKGLIAKPAYNASQTRLEVRLIANASAVNAAQGQEEQMIIVENFYDGWGGIRGVEGAPLPPWEVDNTIPVEPITPTLPLTNPIYLPLIEKAAVQAVGPDGQAVATVDTRHPLSAEHPEYVAHTAAPPYHDVPGVATGLLYGGVAATAMLPPGVKNTIHNTLNGLQTEIDVAQYHADKAIEKAKDWFQERLGR